MPRLTSHKLGEGLFLPSPPSFIRWNKRVSRSWLRRTGPQSSPPWDRQRVLLREKKPAEKESEMEEKCRTLLSLICSRDQRRR